MSGLELGLRDPRPDQPSSFTDHNSQSAALVSGFCFLVSGFWFLVFKVSAFRSTGCLAVIASTLPIDKTNPGPPSMAEPPASDCRLTISRLKGINLGEKRRVNHREIPQFLEVV
jgi:hypothetical protein|tara:strand:- start:1549 stop:1890 length:342 start_codon:yes stop_codon:yes gene_type:complete